MSCLLWVTLALATLTHIFELQAFSVEESRTVLFMLEA